MRRIAVLLALAGIPFCWQPLWGQAPSQDEKEQPKLTTAKATSHQIGTKDEPLIVDTHDRAKTEQEAAEDNTEIETREYRDTWTFRLTILNAIFTGLLVFVGAGGVCLALRTLRTLEMQTEATKASVAVLINSERAWAVVSKTHPLELRIALAPGVVSANRLRFDLTNKGRTVARLMSFQSNSILVDRTQALPEYPQYTDHTDTGGGELGFTHGRVLVPTESMTEVPIDIDHLMVDETVLKLRTGDLRLYVYGLLKYFDFAKEERRLQFCYQYVNTETRWTAEHGGDLALKAQWMIAGPPDYNTHT